MDRILDPPLLTLINGLRTGEISAVDYFSDLESLFLEREPDIHAFLSEEGRFERLKDEFHLLSQDYANPLHRPPLFGVPIGIKDIFHVDGFETGAGSKLSPAVLKGREAESVRLLKEAGALILGKTVTTEFAYFGPGPTRNPHNPEHTPGGSSSGSAAAVAAGFCHLALGTQTIGSINRPAAYCGVVGFKPSYDRISRSGVIPLSPSLDHIGVLASSIAGAELVASVLCPDWQMAVVADRKPLLGIPEGPYLDHTEQEGLDHFHFACDRLATSGYRIKPIEVMSDFDEISQRHQLILAAEAAQVHADWFAGDSHLYHKRTRDLILKGREISVGDLAKALNGRQRLRHELTALMDAYQLDLWISPASTGAAPKGLESTGNPIMNLPWTHAGLPSVTLPSGTNTDGLPLGLQAIGRWYEDEMLLEWSAHMEPVL